MFSFFKRKKEDLKMEGKETSIQANKLIDAAEGETEEAVHPEIYFHPVITIPLDHQYVLRFMNKELPALKTNQLNLSGVGIDIVGDSIEVTSFLRNSLQNNFTIEEAKIILLSKDNEIIAKHTFTFEELGEVPASSSIPWVFKFPLESIKLREFPRQDFTIQFDLTPPHTLEFSELEEANYSEEQKEKLKKLVDSLPVQEENTFNFTPFQIKQLENGFIFTLFIRNFYQQEIQISQLPLELFDATGEKFTAGNFQLEDFKVTANTTRLLTLQTTETMKVQPNLEKWYVRTT